MLTFERHFTRSEPHTIITKRRAVIQGPDGKEVFAQDGVEAPDFWSDRAVAIVSSKYFHGRQGTAERESSVLGMVDRVARTITQWGREDGYFDDENALIFQQELYHILLHQKAAFNSPVWFNVGVPGNDSPQSSACFILGIEDTIESIVNWYATESLIFKHGSGAGINISPLRSAKEFLSYGGRPSGPLSFMRAADSCAGVIKCLTGDTAVWTPQGRRVLADVKVGDSVWDGLHFSGVSEKHVNKEKPLKRITLGYSGLSVTGTPNHPVLTMTPAGMVWKHLSDVEINDKVAVARDYWPDVDNDPAITFSYSPSSRQKKTYTIPQAMSPEFAYILGLFAAEGSLDNERVRFTNGDSDIVAGLQRCWTAVFDTDIEAHWSESKSCYDLQSSCKGIVSLFHHLGVHQGDTASSGTKVVPAILFSSKRGTVCEFLAGYFDGDGHSSSKSYIVTKSAVLRNGVRDILFAIGVASKAFTTTHGYYGVMFTGDALVKFHAQVKPRCKAKWVLPAKINTNVDVIPYVKQALLPFRKGAYIRTIDDGLLRLQLGTKGRRSGAISLNWFKEHLDIIQDIRRVFPPLADAISETLSCNYFWDTVSVIDHQIPPEITYDITIPGKHQFVGNGIVCHNSGGKVRRAAKLVCMDDNHPDIWEFVSCKIESKKQADALRSAGFEMLLGDDSLGVPYTNSNHAIRLTDAFMSCAKGKATWPTLNRTDHKINHEYVASDLLQHIAQAVHFCGDPGVMFHDTINKWNTCLHDAEIKSANPCIEFEWFDDSACNLASLKLTAFLKNGKFDVESFGHAVDILITAQDILIDRSSYPTKKIEENSKHYRPLGLGFTDLGALLMRMGIPYDSDQGRDLAASIASFMTARAYQMSANLAHVKGASPAFERNNEHVFRIFEQHAEAAGNCEHYEGDSLALRACQIWHGLLATKPPIRNMQTTLLAPAGTISFMMDCDTTGIEPELALVKYKQMVGGGVMRIVNGSVESALCKLGYGMNAGAILKELQETGQLHPWISKKHISVFDCAFKAEGSDRCISPQAHLDMMAAVQPCISGAISKTVNLPAATTVDEIVNLIWLAYEKGIKAVTFYRDGSRHNQPLTTEKQAEPKKEVNGTKVKLLRKRLPAECQAYRYKFVVGGEEGYLHMGLFEDGTLGEIFLTLSKEGSTIAGLMDTIATQTSIALQYGVPLAVICEKMKRQRFDPSGITNHPDIHFADSLVDFIGRYLEWRFLGNHNEEGSIEKSKLPDYPVALLESKAKRDVENTGQLCLYCGNPTVFNGRCYTCPSCGENDGGCS